MLVGLAGHTGFSPVRTENVLMVLGCAYRMRGCKGPTLKYKVISKKP